MAIVAVTVLSVAACVLLPLPGKAAGPPCTTTIECAVAMVAMANDLKAENAVLAKQIGDLSSRLSATESLVNTMEEVTLYQCPRNSEHHAGQWATWGCVGQLGNQSRCYNHTYVGSGNAPDLAVACEKVTYWRKKLR